MAMQLVLPILRQGLRLTTFSQPLPSNWFWDALDRDMWRATSITLLRRNPVLVVIRMGRGPDTCQYSVAASDHPDLQEQHCSRHDLRLSELACWCQSVSVCQSFADHATVFAQFGCPGQSYLQSTWPLPSTIPWEAVDIEAWHQSQIQVPVPCENSTQWLHQFAKSFEASLDGFVGELADSRLPKACKGRAKHVEPQCRRIASRLARPSRQGEAQLSCDLVGHEVVTWFKQLRRIQSMKHSLLAGRQEANAQTYRAELWRKIKASRGFCGGFRIWWGTRRIKLQGSPSQLPVAIPSWETCVLIYDDFQANFKAFGGTTGTVSAF